MSTGQHPHPPAHPEGNPMTDNHWVDHWSATADRVFSNSPFLLAEDERGDWYVRRIWRDVYRPVEWWNPLHWLAYVGSRLGRRLVWLERTEEETR